MNIQILLFQLMCLTAAWARTAVEDDQLGEGIVPSSKSPSYRQSPLKSSKTQPSQSSVKSAPSVPQQSAKAAPPPEVPVDYADEAEPKEYEDEASSPSTAASTTETAKKLGSGFVRPFRSNQDLLETLKRRRQDKAAAAAAANGPAHHASGPAPTTAAPTPAVAKAKSSSNRKFNGRSRGYSSDPETDQTGSESEKRTTAVNRRFSGRGRPSPTTEVYEELPEEVPSQQPRAKSFGRSRRP